MGFEPFNTKEFDVTLHLRFWYSHLKSIRQCNFRSPDRTSNLLIKWVRITKL